MGVPGILSKAWYLADIIHDGRIRDAKYLLFVYALQLSSSVLIFTLKFEESVMF